MNDRWRSVACQRPLRHAVVLILVAVTLCGCQLVPWTGTTPTGNGAANTALVAWREGQFVSATGCESRYRLYRIENDAAPVRVLLGHGFLRDQRRMQGLAIDLAALGLPTATLDFCNMRPWRAGVQENAQDLVRLAGQLAAEEVVYAGFSAGGLAALLAAHQDPSSQGVFALDLVDYAGVGRQAAAELQVPLAGLVGEASSCNRFNEALAVYAAASNGVYRQVAGASHCDFESPSDWVCSFVCDSVPRSASEVEHTRSQIRQSALSAIVALANGEEVWP